MSGVLHPKLPLLVALARKVDQSEDDDAVVDAPEVGFDDAPTRTIASAPAVQREDVSNDNVDAAGVDREVDDDDDESAGVDGEIAEVDEPERERDNVHAWRRERLPRMQH